VILPNSRQNLSFIPAHSEGDLFQVQKTTPTRRYLRADFDPENGSHVSHALARLRSEPPFDFASAKIWYETFSELSDATNEIQTRLDLEMSLNTGSKEITDRISRFENDVLIQLMNARAQLMDIYLQSPWRASMHADDRDKIARELQQRRKYTSPKLAQLQIEENSLIRDFKSFSAQATCSFFGRNTSLGVVIGKLNDPRPEIRKEAFLAHWSKIRSSREWLENLFTRLLKNRIEQAGVAGANSYTNLCFSDLGRFDYSAQDCKTFRDSIHQTIVPLVSELQSMQLQSLGSSTLRPWDANVWPKFLPSENPCQGDLDAMLDAGGRIIAKIHPGFGRFFETLLEKRYIDIHPRNMKAPGAFCVVLPESRTPFVFGNFAGHFRDAFTLLHEFGHALHGSATLQIDNPLLRHPGLEYCEVASMGLEFLAQPFLNEFWPRAGDADKAWALHCFNALQFWPFMALLDEWQHTVYDEKLLDAADRSALWRQLSRKYRPNIDWSEMEDFEELGWLSRPHPVTSPFYYIDYGIAQMGGVQLWLNSRKNYPHAVESYIRGLSLGSQRTLPELFSATSLNFDFSKSWVEQLGRVLFEEIGAVQI
jgi:oligoendopeptidase F